jgi:hypothetical protein
MTEQLAIWTQYHLRRLLRTLTWNLKS